MSPKTPPLKITMPENTINKGKNKKYSSPGGTTENQPLTEM